MAVDFFEKPRGLENAVSVLLLKGSGVEATDYQDVQDFVVLAGSQATNNEAPSIHTYLSNLRKDLISKGVLDAVEGSLRFTQDYPFGSPSTASGVCLGRARNGRTEWKNDEGLTLKQIQEATLDTP